MDATLLKRRRRLYVTPEMLEQLLKDLRPDARRVPVSEQLPADLRVSTVTWDDYRHCFAMEMHSMAFDEVVEGQAPPEFETRFAYADRGFTATHVANFFESIRKLDPKAVNELFKFKVECNQAVADHPSIPVTEDANGKNCLSFLGLLNGMLSMIADTKVCRVIDTDDINQDILRISIVSADGQVAAGLGAPGSLRIVLQLKDDRNQTVASERLRTMWRDPFSPEDKSAADFDQAIKDRVRREIIEAVGPAIDRLFASTALASSK